MFRLEYDKEYLMNKYGCKDRYDYAQQLHDRLTHIETILCNLWVLAAMYRHFRSTQIELIFNGLFQENENFKNNENADYEQYIQNNDDFCRRMIKIYLTHIRWEQEYYIVTGGAYDVVYAHNWVDQHILPTLNIPKDWLILEEEDQSWAEFGRFPVHQWRYNYITKDTIEYHPGFDSWGEYFRGTHQKDAAENSLHFSKEALKPLIIGFIREISHDIQSRVSLMSLCIDYLYSAVPICFSWISGWLSNSIIKPIDIHYVTGIVTIIARDGDYEKNWGSKLMCYEHSYPDVRDDKMEIFEGMWAMIYSDQMGDIFYHRIQIQCVENICDFGTGIKKPDAMWLMLVTLKDNMLNIATECEYREDGQRPRTIIDSVCI